MQSIYALIDPRDRQVRYIGKSTDPVRRLAKHMAMAPRESTHKAQWLNVLRRAGLRPILEILIENSVDADAAERQCIAAFLELGCDLTNATPGGDGVAPGTTPANKGHRLDDEEREQLSQIAKHRMETDPEFRAQTMAKLQQMIAGNVGVRKPGSRPDNAERNQSREWTPERCAHMSQVKRNVSDETRRRMSEAAKARVQRIGSVCNRPLKEGPAPAPRYPRKSAAARARVQRIGAVAGRPLKTPQ